MKKLLIVLLLLVCDSVHALEYTDYSSYGDFTPEKIESNDLTDVKIERRYLYYKLNKVLGPYSDKTSLDYSYISDTDYIYSDFSDWSMDRPTEKEGRVIESKTIYHYLKAGPINKILFKPISKDIIISDIKIYNGDDIVNYNTDFNFSTLSNSVYLYLEKDIELSDLSILYTFGNTDKSILEIYCYYDDKNYQGLNIQLSGNGKSKIKNSNFSPDAYDDYYSTDKLKTDKFLTLKEESVLYRYKDKLYLTYNLQKEYYNEYLVSSYKDYIYKDEDNYMDYYAKRTRSIISNEIDNKTNDSKKENINMENTDSEEDLELPSLDNKNNNLKIIKTNNKHITQSNMQNDNYNLVYFILIFIIVLLLVLSKLFKSKIKCARV